MTTGSQISSEPDAETYNIDAGWVALTDGQLIPITGHDEYTVIAGPSKNDKWYVLERKNFKTMELHS